MSVLFFVYIEGSRYKVLEYPIKTEQELLTDNYVVKWGKHYAAILLYSRLSPNGHYKIMWGQNDYYVYDAKSGRLLTCGHRCVNLYTAFIADNGYFLLEEWLNSDALCGRITINFLDGKLIYQNEFPLNIMLSILSENGLFAAVSLCNGPSHLANNLVIIDLRNDTTTAVAFPSIADADNIVSFDTDKNIFTIKSSNNIGYKYSISGIFLDEDKYTVFAESKLVGKKAFMAAKKHLKNLDSTNINDYSNVLSLLQRSLQDVLMDKEKANVYRCIGDIQYRCGNKLIALNAYKNALSFNDKVGVKTIFKQLQKEIWTLK